MFRDIPQAVRERMAELEQLDAQDRTDGTGQLDRLRQIPPETGRFLAVLAAGAPAGRIIEIGTSAGYSTMWLSLACRATGRTVTTFELLEAKAARARETFAKAGIADRRRVHPRRRAGIPGRHRRHRLLLPRRREGRLPRLLRGRRAEAGPRRPARRRQRHQPRPRLGDPRRPRRRRRPRRQPRRPPSGKANSSVGRPDGRPFRRGASGPRTRAPSAGGASASARRGRPNAGRCSAG